MPTRRAKRLFHLHSSLWANAAQEALQEAQSGRYSLQYTPGSPESDGRVKSYTLTARAGNYGYVNLFADETGIIHGTRENRAASAADPRIDSVSSSAP